MKTLRFIFTIFLFGTLILCCKKEKEDPQTNTKPENPPVVITEPSLFVETGSLDGIAPSTPVPITVKAIFKDLPTDWNPSYKIVFERSINNGPFVKVPSDLEGSCSKSGDTLLMKNNSLFTPDLEANYRYKIYGEHKLTDSTSERTETKEVTFNTSNSWLVLKNQRDVAPRYYWMFPPEVSSYPDVYIFTSGSNGNTVTFRTQKAKLLSLDSAAFYNITTAEQLINLTKDTNDLQNYPKVKAGDCIMFSTATIGNPDYPTRRVRKAIAYIKKAYTFDGGYQAYCLFDVKYLY